MPGQKPIAEKGTLCPFFRQDVSKVCHRCEMWEPLPVGRIVATRVERHDQWGCTLKHQTFVLRDVVTGLDGLQKATESFRNTAWNDSQKNIEALIQVVDRSERTIVQAERAIAELPGSNHPLLIDGNSKQ